MTNQNIKKWNKKDLLGIKELSVDEINLILNQAKNFKEILNRPIPKVPTLRGKTIVNLFCEPSTRTRSSFELAAKRLNADILNITTNSSSFLKGETLKDTIKNLEAMKIHMIIMRHNCSGASHFLAKNTNASVINAGDGWNEHPTQALLDAFTIQDKLKNIKGLNISIIGDILHSRVARSNLHLLKKLGANVTICGPKTLIPLGIEKMGINITYNIKEAIQKADVLNILRIQFERQNESFLPNIREYRNCFGITLDLVKKHAKENIIILHPGPINRGIEIDQDVADSKYSVILEQVTNGVAIRMAVLFLLSQQKQD